MVHTLVPMSVEIKMADFDPPARLINHMELSCAIGMACRQARLECPKAESGMDLKEFVKRIPPEVFDAPEVDEKLKFLIQNYIYKAGEKLDEDSLITLQLGYAPE